MVRKATIKDLANEIDIMRESMRSQSDEIAALRARVDSITRPIDVIGGKGATIERTQFADVITMARTNQKIAMIKLARIIFNLDLKSAKDMVDLAYSNAARGVTTDGVAR